MSVDPERLAATIPPGAGAPGPWYESHLPELRRLLLGVLRDPHAAEDVMQDCLAKALDGRLLEGVIDRKAWLFRVAYREALTLKRRQAVRDKAHRRLAWLDGESAANPADPVAREEAAEAVREALDALPEDQRRVVRARIYEEKTFAEIAEEQGAPLGTVQTRMRRALVRLRGALGGKEV